MGTNELNGINKYLFEKMQKKFLFLNIFLLFNILNTNGKLINLINCFSEVHLIVDGIGNINILNDAFIFEPSKVTINGNSKNCKKFCNFERYENNVTLHFNDSINNCENMFYLSEYIKEIDLSKFDFSKVTTMNKMF